MTTTLFDLAEAIPAHSSATMPPKAESPPVKHRPRLRVLRRDQVEMQCFSLDQLLEADHAVRLVWLTVCGLDLSRWLVNIQAVEHEPGRNATDPRLLLALWVYATTRGVGSARTLAKLCSDQGELPYRWLCGGVSVNYHTLSDFRSENGVAWDDLVTQIVASLMHEGLVTLQRVAQDGMRVEASAGTSSFRRQPTLQKCWQEAHQQVEILKTLSTEQPAELSKCERAARERATREREQRLQQALKNCAELQAQREIAAKKVGKTVKDARASTTDPEARHMKFPDGGYAPGYSVQFSTDTNSGVIVGVDLTNSGTDYEAFLPMLKQIQQRYQQTPAEALCDGGFVTIEAIEQAAAQGCIFYAPPPAVEQQLAKGLNPYAKKRRDTPVVEEWRKRMGTAEAQAIYKLRAQNAEWVNMFARQRNLWTMPVRGKAKCKTIAMLFAVTHNLLQGAKLRQQLNRSEI